MRAWLLGLALVGSSACDSGTLKGADGRATDAPRGREAGSDTAVDHPAGDRATGDRPLVAPDVAAKDLVLHKDKPKPADQLASKDKPATDKSVLLDKPKPTDKPLVADKPADKTTGADKPQTSPDAGSGGGPTIAGCPVFPAASPWNTDISSEPVDPNSSTIIAAINANGGQYLHPDFSSTAGWNPPYGAGIPYVVVPGTQPKVCVSFQYASESDPGPYPIPPNPPIEGGPSSSGDRHILVIDKDSCKLYETFASSWNAAQSCWSCGSGAVFDLKSNLLRTDCWTSADAAGLPIFPGLARYDEAVTAGVIKHALRVTFAKTRQAFVHPATHYASNDPSPSLPPMGLRLRLKSSFNVNAYSGAAKVILVALQKYGLIVADNGSNWYLSGAPHASWNDSNLNTLKQVPGTAFEVVKPSGKLYTAADCP